MTLFKKTYFLLIFLLLSQLIIKGQEKKSATYQKDTAHVNLCIKQCQKLIFIYPDSSKKYCDTILSLSQKTNYEYGLYSAYILKGNIFWVTNNLDKAIIEFKKAMQYANSPEFPRRKAVVLINIALIYSGKYNTDSTLFYLNKTIQYSKSHAINDIYIKALFDLSNFYMSKDNYVETARNLIKVRDELKINPDSNLLMLVHSAFGILYYKLNNFEQSLSNYRKAIEIDNKISNIDNLANNYLNIGELFFRIKKSPDSAIYYYRKSVNSALPHHKSQINLAVNINLGNVFFENMQIDSAKIYYQKAYDDSLINFFPDRKAAIMVNLGLYYLKTNDFINAQSFLNSGLTICDSLEILQYKKNALLALSQLDSINGNFQLSLEHFKAYHKASDSIGAIDAALKIAVLDFEKFMVEQKLNNELLIKDNYLKNNQINNQKIIIWLSLTSTIFLLILLYSLFRNRLKIKRLLNQLSEKHENLLSLNEELKTNNEILNTQQEQLRALNITKDKFFAILGHDLKGPFGSLMGLLSVLDEEWDEIDDNIKRSHVQSLFASSEKTYYLLEDLLNWGKVQQGLMKCQNETFNVDTIITKVADLLMAQVNNKNQHLKIEISPEMNLNSDPRLFSQIIQNLLNNAIKYTHQGGIITIKGETAKDETSICISDTGIGIPEDKILHLFDLDSDFNRPGTENEKSSGMGLILCREYANLLGANLTVKSIEGKGSVFCLNIPK
ncbi:MAG: tetratricopeptide repeat protein [Saprospiraceae bacterium]|nr:tetratricopeptide repeat protein [Saprospiraceae bacterium]